MRILLFLSICASLVFLAPKCFKNQSHGNGEETSGESSSCEEIIWVDNPCFDGFPETVDIPECVSPTMWKIIHYETLWCEDIAEELGVEPECCAGGACDRTEIGEPVSCASDHSCLFLWEKYYPIGATYAVCGLKKCISSNELAYFYYDTQGQTPALDCRAEDQSNYFLYPHRQKEICPENTVCVSSDDFCIPDTCQTVIAP